MRKDATQFRERFKRWLNGEKVYDAGKALPRYEEGKTYNLGTLPEVVVTPYSSFHNTLPDNQRNTPESKYTMHRFWELNGKPKTFQEAVDKRMFTFENDKKWHASSVAQDEFGDYEFMKPISHPTEKMELNWYFGDEGKSFRDEYDLILDPFRPGFHKYAKKRLHFNNQNMAGKTLPKYYGGKPEETYDGGLLPQVTVTAKMPSKWRNNVEMQKQYGESENDYIERMTSLSQRRHKAIKSVNRAQHQAAKDIFEVAKQPAYFVPGIGNAVLGADVIGQVLNKDYVGAAATLATVGALKYGTPYLIKGAKKLVGNTLGSYLYKKTGSTKLPTNIQDKIRYMGSFDLDGKGRELLQYKTPFQEFRRQLSNANDEAYFLMAPKDVPVHALRNARHGYSYKYGRNIDAGEVDGHFVSYGEPWMEFGISQDRALYKFPVARKRGKSIMATDWTGNKMDYPVDEMYDFMRADRNIRRSAIKKSDNLPEKINFIQNAYKNLYKKHPEYKTMVNDVWHGNQTVIPSRKWNYQSFLKEPFYRYTEDPVSGQVQTELMINQPKNNFEQYVDKKASANYFNNLLK